VPARPSARIGVVAGVGEAVVDAELHAAADDVGLRHVDERCDDLRLAVLDAVIERVKGYGCNLVEITGGEPLAQSESFELIRRLCDDGFEVLIETSGSIDVAPVDPRAKIILDVKCPGSGEAEKNRWENLDILRPHDEIKFVIADRNDYDWARRVVQERDLGRWTVLFSPVWGEMEMKSLAEWMLADRIPARLQTQLHKHIWGAEARGV